MTKTLIILIFCICLNGFSILGNCQSSILEENKIENDYIERIDIFVNIIPIKNSQYCYNFSTNSKSQIYYIIHMLNSMDFINDGKIINGADIPIININLIKKDNSTDNYGFVNGRFYDTTNKQYAVSVNEYMRFLDFIYALETNQIILEDEVTFDVSNWAEEDVDKAIESGLVPKWNQINYKGKINRLEVCQLIDNFLKINSIECHLKDINPFSDTSDPAVTSLYLQDIINGKSATGFCPYDLITREEFAKILSNTYNLLSNDTISDVSAVLYNDQEKISEWAKESVDKMTALGIFNGNENGEFEPLKNITKEEVIVTLLRLTNKLK